MHSKPVVLHVDDRDDMAFLFQEAMLEAGCFVTLFRVCDGEEALAFLRHDGRYPLAERPGLVVLDINMPKVDGWAVLDAMRLDAALSDIPVVILSTSAQKGEEARALSLGARKFIPKPLLFEDWVRQIRLTLAAFLPGDVDSPAAE